MASGSLDMWLHPEKDEANSSKTLNLIQRLNVAGDVASALHYLHNHCETPIIHCDLKPSNILLDDDMSARVADFGLARLRSDRTSSSLLQQQTSSIGIKGSLGYAAPESGMGGNASTHGDVYSYGILLLEMFRGRRPTDEMFKDVLNLYNYVKRALPQQVMHILDPILLEKEEEGLITAAGTEEDEKSNTGSSCCGREGILEFVSSVLVLDWLVQQNHQGNE